MPKITFTLEDAKTPDGTAGVMLQVNHDVPAGQEGFSPAMLIGAAVLRMWKSGELEAAPNRLCQDIILKMNVDHGKAS